MNKVSLFALIFMFITSLALTAQVTRIKAHNESDKIEKKEKINGPVAEFDKLVNDFGEIKQGIPRTAIFKLTNKGNEPLLISYAKASCGCTNLKYSKEPIMPGKSIEISATYNAAAPGKFIKTISVITNADTNKVMLQIRGTVIKKPVPVIPQKK